MAKYFLIAPRWSKVWADLWRNKMRTFLVVLSISVGVFAVGMVYSSYLMFQRDLAFNWGGASPASATLYTDLFNDELVDSVRSVRRVQVAEGRRNVVLRVLGNDGLWQQLMLVAIPDYLNQKVNIIRSQSGVWPPAYGDVLLERSSLPGLDAKQGSIMVEAKDGRKRTLKVTGVVYDPTQIPTLFSGSLHGYISMDTLDKLDEVRLLSQVDFVVQPWVLNEQNTGAVATVGRQVWTKLEQSGTLVSSLQVNKSGEHPMQEPINALNMLMAVLGVLVLCSATLLLVNTISGILTQHVRQIAIMKAIGGRQTQIVRLYLALVAGYGFLALWIAVPLGALAASEITGVISKAFNFDSGGIELPPKVLLLEVVVAILVPVMASLWPVWRGVGGTVREAISDYGISGVEASTRLDRWVDAYLSRLKGLPRPILLSLRNTFRRKGRLALALVTLTLAGTIFMAVLSVRLSLYSTLDQYLDYFHYDVSLFFTQNYQTSRVEQEILKVPGVKTVEPWGYASGRLLRNGLKESEEVASQGVVIYGPPPDTVMIHPKIIEGRWLVKEDESALVVTTDVVKDNPGIKVGGPAIIKVGNRKLHCTVVGVIQSLLGPPAAYAPYKWLTEEMQQTGKTTWVQIVAGSENPKEQHALGQRLEEHLKKNSMHVQKMNITWELKQRVTSQFDIITTFLLFMSVLLAIVGGLGLAGTMGINVLERTREIGVMRAIGASSMEIGKLFVVEALFIGLISWLVGGILALPIAAILSYQVGMLFLHHPLSLTISLVGGGIWLVLSVLLSVLASLLPAWNATRLSVRDVLNCK